MNPNTPELLQLWQNYWSGEIEEAELQSLLQLLENASAEEKEALLLQSWQDTGSQTPVFTAEESRHQLQQLLQQFRPESIPVPVPVIPFYKRSAFRWAAACFVLLAGLAFLLLRNESPQTGKHPQTVSELSKVLPANNGAILVLSDGRSISVDSAHASVLTETGVTLSDQGNGLDYSAQQVTKETSIPVHELRTTRGMKYSFLLPDGSRVWLNAASRLRFPAQFSNGNRWVELEGEACFDVKPQTNPFLVKLNTPEAAGTVIKVLGTHFNIEAYAGDDVTRATLVSGKIAVERLAQNYVLTPGQQARLAAGNNQSITIHHVNTSQAIAWTKDLFQFEEDDLQTVMKQIARWYGIDIVYKGNLPPMRFKGKIQRNLPLSQVLELLDADISYQLSGKQLLITPKNPSMNN